MKKTIIFTVINDLTYDQRMHRIVATLADAGFDCVLVGRSLATSKKLGEKAFKQVRLKCLINKGFLFYAEYNIRLFVFLLLNYWDAVCSVDVDTALAGIWVSKIKHKKHAFDAHEIFTEVPEVKDRKFVQSIWESIQRYTFKNTDISYTVGKALANYFENKYGNQVAVVRNIPALSTRLEYNPDAEKFILYQGALNRGRGLEKLLHAMQELPCKLVIAGEGDLSVALRKLTNELGINSKVEFKGYVLPEDLKVLTTKAWLGINVSENEGLSYYLSINNKFFDYIHAGLPSLINKFPEYEEINLQYNVGVIVESNVTDMVKNAMLLLNDEALHLKLSDNCKKASEDLNWENESKLLINLYHTLFEE